MDFFPASVKIRWTNFPSVRFTVDVITDYRALQRIGEISLETLFPVEAVGDGADVTFSGGRVFHSRNAATGKARSAMAERRVRQMMPKQSGAKMTGEIGHIGMTELSSVGI